MAVCAIKCADLTKDSIKTLGVFYLYNEKLKMGKVFLRTITNIEKALKLWRMRNLTFERKITIFKTLAQTS